MSDLSDLAGSVPDERLLGDDMHALPDGEQRPLPERSSRLRRRLVAVGATLTGLTLVAGVVLVVAGVLDAAVGSGGVRDIVAIVIGVGLVATHWGWVHVAEASADALEARRDRELGARSRGWLSAIEPYTRYSVTTSVLDDGAIRIARFRHRPVPAGERTFSFVREREREEVHDGDEPAGAVAERTEALRRAAALDTERERQRWRVVADAYEAALIDSDDEQQRLAARRAASEALSERLNAHLREPPLVE